MPPPGLFVFGCGLVQYNNMRTVQGPGHDVGAHIATTTKYITLKVPESETPFVVHTTLVSLYQKRRLNPFPMCLAGKNTCTRVQV